MFLPSCKKKIITYNNFCTLRSGYMKKLNIQFIWVSSLLIASVTLLFTHIGCTNNAIKNDVSFDLQPKKITKPAGMNDE